MSASHPGGQARGWNGEPLTPGYSREKYQQEKLSGERLPNGSHPIEEPKPRHIHIVRMHLEGYSNKFIADAFKLSEPHISTILRSPKVRAYIDRVMQSFDYELSAKFGKVVKNMDNLLESPDENIKLRATELWLKSQGKFKRDAAPPETAEDLIRKFVEITETRTIRVVGEERRAASSRPGAVFQGVESGQDVSQRKGLQVQPRRLPELGERAEDARQGDEALGGSEDEL